MRRNVWSLALVGLLVGTVGAMEARAESSAEQPAKKGYWVASASVQIEASAEQVFRYTGELQNWQLWTSWNKEKDPTGTWSYGGTPRTAGHEMSWDGPELGKGRLVFTGVEGTTAKYDLFFGKSKTANTGYISAEGAGPVTVTWYTEGKLKGFGKLFKKKIEAAVNKDFQDGLSRLEPLVEAVAAREAHAAKLSALEARLAEETAAKAALDQRAAALLAEATAASKAADEAMAAAKKPAAKKAAADAKAAAEAKKSEASKAEQEAAAQGRKVDATKAELEALKAAAPPA